MRQRHWTVLLPGWLYCVSFANLLLPPLHLLDPLHCIPYSPLHLLHCTPSTRELDASGAVASRTGYRMGGCIARFVTDFLVTEHYYVVLQVGTWVMY